MHRPATASTVAAPGLRGRPEETEASPRQEAVLGRYRLLERLGAGGQGAAWRAYDEKLEREVAVKVIERAADDPWAARAEREARVAARLNHPGIVSLYELGGDDHAVYLVSELVPGRTLAELARAGALSDLDIGRIGAALCDALAHAHDRGVVHRDVKPQNVLVVAEPAAGAGFAKLTDFGVARLAEADPLTRTGDVVGTLAYMAPEQAVGGEVTSAADVYSLALTLYEGWTGVHPLRARAWVRPASRVGPRLPPLRRLRRDLPPDLCRTLDLCLDARPERRPSLAALRETLEDSLDYLSDEGGLVEPGQLERLGLARRAPAGGRAGRGSALLARVGAGGAAGALAAAALEAAAMPTPFAPFALAGGVALLVAVLPRAGWLVAATVVVGATAAAGSAGTALLLTVALAPVPLLLPRAGVLWSTPALAPLLGAAGLAPLFVALAGFASTARRRAGLAAAGLLSLVVAEAITGDALLFGPAGSAPSSSWAGSAAAAAREALLPLLTSPAAAALVVWAAFAAALPLAVRGRTTALDLVGGALWAAGLVAAHSAVAGYLAPEGVLTEARGPVAGAVTGLAVALAGRAVLARRRPVGEATVP